LANSIVAAGRLTGRFWGGVQGSNLANRIFAEVIASYASYRCANPPKAGMTGDHPTRAHGERADTARGFMIDAVIAADF
jgi:hypothetical protein